MQFLRTIPIALLLIGHGFAQTAEFPTVWVVGDSTASNANRRGWADPFADYFDPAKATTVNRARAGRSSRTFITEGLWDKVRTALKPGDYVLIQFGHNDGGPPDTDRARGSLAGLGEESKESHCRTAVTKWSTRSATTCGRWSRTRRPRGRTRSCSP